MGAMKLTLTRAIAENRLSEFIAQAEAEGIGPADKAQLEEALRRMALKPPQLSGRTSHSPFRDGSREK
jgi:hypothetical protein